MRLDIFLWLDERELCISASKISRETETITKVQGSGFYRAADSCGFLGCSGIFVQYSISKYVCSNLTLPSVSKK